MSRPAPRPDLDVAILHDQFRTFGGAERVAVEMARALDAPVYAARVDDGVLPADIEAVELFDGLAGRAMHQHHHVQDLVQMYGWQHRPEIWSHDIVLVNKTNPMWYVPRDHQTVLAYLHSTPRSMYDQFDVHGGGLSTAIQTAMRTLFNGNRTRADAVACNSELVQRRASLYWDRQRNIRTLHPPVDVEHLGPDIRPTGDYYLTVGRLARNKQVGDIIRAFHGSERELVIAGDGPERDRLKSMADGHSNIDLRGYVSEAEKRRLLSGAQAFVMNAECEDFGLTPIEAMASGTPVVGVKEGFTAHQVTDGATGVLYTRGNLASALDRFERHGVVATERDLAETAAGFSAERFRRELVEWVLAEDGRTDIEMQWPAPADADQPLISDGGDDVRDE